MIVEDDSFLLLAVTEMLKSKGFEPTSFSDAVTALSWASTNPLDVALLDLHLGEGPTGLDLAWELRRMHPHVGLVFLTSFSDPKLLSTSLPKLPKGSVYLKKSDLRQSGQLLNAIQKSLDIKSQKEAVAGSPLSSLTGSQIETLKLVALGYSNSEIAKRRFVTEKSVEQTITRASKSLGLASSVGGNQRVNLAKAFFEETGLKVIE